LIWIPEELTKDYCFVVVPVSLQGSLSFMEDSGLSQPLTPSKPLAPAVEVTSVSFVSLKVPMKFFVLI